MNSPFNVAKYKALLEGLEAVEIRLSEVLKVETFRLDSDYVQKKYLSIINKVKINNQLFKSFTDLGIKVDASAFYPSLVPYYNTGNVPFLRVADVDTLINYENCVKIPKEIVEDINFKTLNVIQEGDIVITKGGSIARIGLIEQDTAVTRDLIFLNSSILSEVNYKFLYLYLLSSISYNLLIRSSSMTAQPHLTIGLVKNLPIFNPDNVFKKQVVDIYNLSKEKLEQSKTLYKQSEELLLKELDLSDFKPSNEPVNIKSFKNSFVATGRLDAEYYQKKYEQVIDKIKSKNYDFLKNLVSIKKSIEPGSKYYVDEGVPFLRVADYDKFGLSKPDKKLSDEFVKDNQALINGLKPQKETILFSKDGSVGTAYMLRKDADFITSGAILHLSVKDQTKIIPEYLTLALNSKVVQMQAERDAGGSIILHWRVSEIENVVVPLIDYTKQQQIAELIEESFALKKQSEKLLETAKRAVEIAVEENEEKAIKYINSKVS